MSGSLWNGATDFPRIPGAGVEEGTDYRGDDDAGTRRTLRRRIYADDNNGEVIRAESNSFGNIYRKLP